MVGGTKLPPQDSVSEPGCYERKTRATARTKAKTLYEGKRQKPSQVYVSLDNADTVIEGAPSGLRLAGWVFSFPNQSPLTVHDFNAGATISTAPISGIYLESHYFLVDSSSTGLTILLSIPPIL